ncbi:MAG: histidine kinase [Ignavibacteria bacterium]|nr:histidine kinase [Ignavibacteria bacterium]
MTEAQSNVFLRYYRSSQHKIYLVGLLTAFLFIVALAVAFQHYYIIDVEMVPRFSLSWHIPFNIFYFLIWLLFLPLIQWSDSKLRHKESHLINGITFYFLLPVIFVIIHQLIASVVIVTVLDYRDLRTLIYQRVLENPWIWEDFVIYFLIMAIINIEDYQTKTDNHLLKVSQLQSQLAQTHLRALKSQLHPHFLFNTLNTLSTLILKQDNAEAERMLGLLEKFLKTTLNENDKSEVSLSEELKFIRHYLEIEKVRFKDKLVVEEVIDIDTLKARVPVF